MTLINFFIGYISYLWKLLNFFERIVMNETSRDNDDIIELFGSTKQNIYEEIN